MTYIKKYPWDYDLEEAMKKYGLWANTKYPYEDLKKHDKIITQSNQHSITVDPR